MPIEKKIKERLESIIIGHFYNKIIFYFIISFQFKRV